MEFDSLTLQVGHSNGQIRRLSTPSSEKEGQKFNGLATEWVWFWEDMDKSWKQYGSQVLQVTQFSDQKLQQIL